jgi:hypothetical protein
MEGATDGGSERVSDEAGVSVPVSLAPPRLLLLLLLVTLPLVLLRLKSYNS